MSQDNILPQILDNSRDCLHWILTSNQATDLDKVMSLAHQISYTLKIPTFPYFADRLFRYESPFAATCIHRMERKGLLKSNPLHLTRRGKSLTPDGPLQSVPPQLVASEIILPYSRLPSSTLNIGSKTVRIKPQIGDLPLIMTTLLPPDPIFFLIFSHFDKDGMRTAYPLLKKDNTYISLFMGDVRNIMAIPDPSLLDNCYQSLISYLGKYVKDFETHLNMVLYLLLCISRIRFAHLCDSNMKLLNNLNDEIQWMLDFTPECDQCGMNPRNHVNFVNLRHSLGHAWEKGVLSELFFAKLVTQVTGELDPSIEVYPRLIVQGLIHECDTFVRKDDKIFLFELKRSTNYDRRCEKGVQQLKENKEVLEDWGVNCVSVLVTNMTNRVLPDKADVDEHWIPDDVMNLRAKLGSLVS